MNGLRLLYLPMLAAVLLAAGSPPRAEAQGRPNDERYVYVCPVGGLWRWDEPLLPEGSFDDPWKPAWGLRAGYAPIRSLALEVAVLRGSNTVTVGEGSGDLDATSVDLSGVVYFRGLGSRTVYPTLVLGAGYLDHPGIRVGDLEVEEANNLTFHLGVGFRAELSRHLSLRMVAQDTFYNEDHEVSESNESSGTVDLVEVSLGLEVRFPLGGSGDRDRLR